MIVHFYGVIDKQGKLHDLAVYSPNGHRYEEVWKDVAQKWWRFKPATCDGRPITSELQMSLGTEAH